MKALNLKNMKEAMVNYSVSQEEFAKIWNVFYKLAYMGFISWETWAKFYEQCYGWYYDEEGDCIRDECHCKEGVDNIVSKYTLNADYRA